MAEIITLAQAKMGAKLDASLTLDDADLQLRLDAAHALVRSYVDNRVSDGEAWSATVAGWDATSAPDQVKGAILAMFTHIVRFRGDDSDSTRQALEAGNLPDSVRMYVQRMRDHSLA